MRDHTITLNTLLFQQRARYVLLVYSFGRANCLQLQSHICTEQLNTYTTHGEFNENI